MNLLVQSLRAVFRFADDAVVLETVDERGAINHERVSVSQRELNLGWRSLVRIVGPLERATSLLQLHVSPTNLRRLYYLTQLSRSVAQKRLRRRATVRIRIDAPRRSPRESSVCVFVVLVDSSAAPIEPFVVFTRCDWPNDGADRAFGVNKQHICSLFLIGTVF
jgi:hypothetical protein